METQPIRILHVVNTLGLGGTEKSMLLFATHTNNDLFEPCVFSTEDGERAATLRQQGIKTYIGQDLLTVLTHCKPHIVHLHRAGWPEPALLRPITLAKPPVVIETNVFGHHDPSPAAAIIDKTLFVSQFCLKRFLDQNIAGIRQDRYAYLYNPVDTDFFKEATRSKPPLAKPVIGRISRPDPGKWSTLALSFLPDLVSNFPDLDYRIVGAIPEAKNYVKNCGFESNVTFLPLVHSETELANFMLHISLLAHANDTGESFGLTIAEAMACALPVVTHRAEGLRDNAQMELVDHGKTGFVAKTPQEYAEAIRFLLSHPEEARQMGMVGQDKANRLYRVQTVTTQLELVYLDMLKKKGFSL